MKHKMQIAIVGLIALAAVPALSACGSLAPAGTATTEQPHTINVTGSGVAYGRPDIAVAQIGVQTRHADPAKAVAGNTEKMQAIMAALKGLGIDEKDIQTTNFSVYAQQNYDDKGQPTDLTYVVDNSVSVTVRDLTKVGDVLGKSTAAGANTVNGVSFSVSDQSALEAQARDKAMADAKARAQQLAAAAGVSLDKPLNISEYSSGPVYADSVKLQSGMGGGGGAPVPVSTGQIQVSLQVSVTYIIK